MGRWTAVGVEVERAQRSADERPRGRRGSAAYWSAVGNEAKTLWFKSSAASLDRMCAGDVVARAGAQPYLGPRTRVRRHDDGWGARRAGCQRGAAAQSFREVHPTAGWRQETCGSWPRASA